MLHCTKVTRSALFGVGFFCWVMAVLPLVAAEEASPEVKAMPVRTPPPDYPRQMLSRQITGVVSLLVEIDSQGNVSECKIEKASRSEFEKPAQEAVLKWKFKPAERAGKPVASRLLIPLHFRLE